MEENPGETREILGIEPTSRCSTTGRLNQPGWRSVLAVRELFNCGARDFLRITTPEDTSAVCVEVLEKMVCAEVLF